MFDGMTYPLHKKWRGQMKTKKTVKLVPTSLLAFLFLCVFWFLKVTGLLSGILH